MNKDSMQAYSRYLQGRNPLRKVIYRLWIYPRIAKWLSGKVLDIGCGIGDFLEYRPNTVGIDINPYNISYCRDRGLEAVVLKDDHYPFDAGAFDGGVMDNVLEHLSDPQKALGEACRVIRKGGTLIVGVPGRRAYAHDPDHKIFYDDTTLVDCLKAHGFIMKQLFYTPLWKSDWLDRHLRQYCVYGVFEKA